MRRFPARRPVGSDQRRLLGREGHVGGTAADNRLFVEAVLFRFRADVPWRDLPERFGDWKIVYQRFNRWAKSGVFERVFKLLANDHDNEYMMIDATIVRAHQHSAGAQKRGRASHRPIPRRIDHRSPRGCRCPRQSRRDHAQPGPGSRSDLRQALIEALDPHALIADKAFDANSFISALNARAITPVIPPKSNRKTPRPCDFILYCERNLIERFFNKSNISAPSPRATTSSIDFPRRVQLASPSSSLTEHRP